MKADVVVVGMMDEMLGNIISSFDEEYLKGNNLFLINMILNF